MRHVLRRHRPGARRLCRRSSAGWCASRSSASSRWSASLAASARTVQHHAAELSAGRGSGRVLRRHAPAARAPRSTAPRPSSRRSRTSSSRSPASQGVLSVVGFNFIDGLASSNQAFFVIRLKPYEERTDAAESVGAIIAAPAAAARRDPGRHRLPVQPAADHRPRQHRRLPIRARGAAGPAARPTSPPSCAACWSPPTSSPSSPACSAPSPPTRRRSISTSTATRRRCWASRSATSSTRCSRRSAASTSTTSTCSAAPGRSTSRPRRRSANSVDDIYRIYVRNAQGAMVPIRALGAGAAGARPAGR